MWREREGDLTSCLSCQGTTLYLHYVHYIREQSVLINHQHHMRANTIWNHLHVEPNEQNKLGNKKSHMRLLVKCLFHPDRCGWPESVGGHPTHWKVAGLIHSQGTCLGCRFGPWLGHMWKTMMDWCFSLTLCLSPCHSPPLPLWKWINKIF